MSDVILSHQACTTVVTPYTTGGVHWCTSVHADTAPGGTVVPPRTTAVQQDTSPDAMPRFTITIPDNLDEWLDDKTNGDNAPYDSKSEAARDLLSLAKRVDDREEDLDTLIDRAERAADLERENERLQNEKRALIEDREERTELVKFAEQQRELSHYQERRQRLLDQAGLATRLKWKLTGVPVDGEHPEHG